MNRTAFTRWLLPLVVLAALPPLAVAGPRKVIIKGTVEDSESPGTRVDDITVRVMTGYTKQGESRTATVRTPGGMMESGVFEFEVQLDDTRPVINLDFHDRHGRYVDDSLSLLVGQSALVVPKALTPTTSPRVSARHVRSHLEVVASVIADARQGAKSPHAARDATREVVAQTVRLAARFRLDEGLQAEVGRLVQFWDMAPSAALIGRDRPMLTFATNKEIVRIGRETQPRFYPHTAAGFPQGKWDITRGGMIISPDINGGIMLYDNRGERPDPMVLRVDSEFTGRQSVVAAAPEGRLFASASSGGAITLLDRRDALKPPQRVRTLHAGPGAVRALAFAPRGDLLAAATLFGTLILWKTGDGQELVRRDLKDAAPNSLAFSDDGSLLAIGCGIDRKGTVILYDLTRRDVVRIYGEAEFGPAPGAVTSATFAGERQFLLVEFDHHRGVVVNRESGKIVRTLEGMIVPSADAKWVGLLREDTMNDPSRRAEIKPIETLIRP